MLRNFRKFKIYLRQKFRNNDNKIYYLFSYTIEDWWISNYNKKNYEIFNENIFDNDYKNLIKFPFYKEVYEMRLKLQNIKKNYDFLSINLNKKNLLFDNLLKEIKNKYKENINDDDTIQKLFLKGLYIVSEFLYNLSLSLFNLIRFKDCSYFKDKVVENLEKIKKHYGFSYFEEIDKNKIEKIFNTKKSDTKEKVVKLVELINYTAIRLIQEVKSSNFRTKIETNIDELYSYTVSEQDLINDLKYINNETKNLKGKIEDKIKEYK